MKRITLVLVSLMLIAVSIFSQAPQAFKYQAVARNSTTGALLQNQSVSFRITLLQGGPTGTTVYKETHLTTTNSFGLANLDIGKGTVIVGPYSSINWSAGAMYMKVEIDPAGGSSYIPMGTSELLSTPYANFDGDWRISGTDMSSAVSGNVGIGTTSTLKGKLDVLQYYGGTVGSAVSSYNHQLVLGGNYNVGPHDATGVKLWIGGYDNDGHNNYPIYCEDENNLVDFFLKSRTNESTGMPTMFFDGRFGIGTTTPTNSRIHLEGANSYDATIRLNNTGTNGTDCFMAATSDTWSSGGNKFAMGFGVPQSSNIDMVLSGSGNLGIGGESGLSRLYVEASTGSTTYPSMLKGLVVKDGDNNTASDFEIQDFTGAIKFLVDDYGLVGINNDSPLGRLTVESQSGVFGNFTSTEKGLVIKDGAYNSANDFEIQSNGGTMKFVVNDDGYVGIGTANPTHTLSVNGTIRAKEVIVNTGWSDFVFEKDYKLMPFHSLEKYIKDNKHLPDIPFASEVENNGISIGEMDSKLLQKIEELTLYMIELNKKVENLQNENNALREQVNEINQ
jgi:hypothetical protein